MRIAHIDHSGLPGGGQLGLLRFARSTHLHEHFFHFLSDGPVFEELVSSGTRTTLSEVSGISARTLWNDRATLRREICAIEPDVIIANSLRSAVAVAAMHTSVPSIYYVRQDMTRESMGAVQGAIARNFVFPRFHGFLANSQWTLTTVPARLRRRTPTGVAFPLSGASEFFAQPKPLAHPVRLAWVGRIAEWKGIHVLFEALSMVREPEAFTLDVAGGTFHEDPAYADRMSRIATGMGTRVRFHGHIADVSHFLRDKDILVHTSIRPEPFGQVVVQGMAAGLAVIATKGGGPSELIDDRETGFLVPPNNARALATALDALQAADPQSVTDVQTRAHNRAVQSYSDESLARAFERGIEILANSIQQRRHRR